MRVAEETPETKNCGVRTKTASKTHPSDGWRFALLFFESLGPLRITVGPDKLASDDGYATRPLPLMIALMAGSLLKGDRMTCVLCVQVSPAPPSLRRFWIPKPTSDACNASEFAFVNPDIETAT